MVLHCYDTPEGKGISLECNSNVDKRPCARCVVTTYDIISEQKAGEGSLTDTTMFRKRLLRIARSNIDIVQNGEGLAQREEKKRNGDQQLQKKYFYRRVLRFWKYTWSRERCKHQAVILCLHMSSCTKYFFQH